MNKNSWKIILVLAAAGIFWAQGCASPDGPNMDAAQYGDVRLVARVTASSATYLDVRNDSDGTFYSYTMNMQLSTAGTMPGTEASTDLYVESYRIDYISGDTAAVPLPPLNVPFGQWIEPRQLITWTGLPLFASSTSAAYYNTAVDVLKGVSYDARITFTVQDTYGNESNAVADWFIIVADLPG